MGRQSSLLCTRGWSSAWLLPALLIALSISSTAMAAAGKIEFVHGAAIIVDSSGNARPADKGSEFDAGETLQTIEGRMQAKFVDGGYISLQPNTSFKVEEYHYNGVADGSERGIFRLIKGGLRAITGVIGHANKPNYRMDTPVATIGIRGTEFTAALDDAQRLLVKVGDGAVFMENHVGNLVLYKGQSGEAGALLKPTYSAQQPLLAAAGPARATADTTQQDRQREQAETQSFVLGDNKSGIGAPCLGGLGGQCISGGDITERLMSAYHLAGMQGQWSGTSELESTQRFNLLATGTLNVDFAQYSAKFSLILANPYGNAGWNTETMVGDVSGKLKSNGGLVFADGTMSGGVCTNACDLIVHKGQLGGYQLSDANINFTVRANNQFDSLQKPLVNNHHLELHRVDSVSNQP